MTPPIFPPQVDKMSSTKSSEESAKLQEFSSFFQTIVQDLTAEDRGHPEVGDAISRLQKVSPPPLTLVSPITHRLVTISHSHAGPGVQRPRGEV